MISDVYNQDNGIDFILSETDRIGEYNKLPAAAAMKLRLLTEEILSLTVRLFDDLKYDFFIECEGSHFVLNLSADTFVNLDQKDKVLSLSSKGENVSAKGVLGKISSVFENMIMGNIGNDFIGGNVPIYISSEYTDTYFSMTSYQNQIPEPERIAEWDGLEKSIIAQLADDVTIGVKSDKVEVIASITF